MVVVEGLRKKGGGGAAGREREERERELRDTDNSVVGGEGGWWRWKRVWGDKRQWEKIK